MLPPLAPVATFAALAFCFCPAFPASAANSEPETVPLWQKGPPSGLHHDAPESSEDKNETGRLDRWIGYVSNPTLTFYPAAQAAAPHPFVLVVPGGGFRYVCIDKEGIEVARWLNSVGLGAAVLKYRTLDPSKSRNAKSIAATFDDLPRALRVVRHGAKAWGIDPDRIGVIGFSAGGILALQLANTADDGDRGSADPVDKVSSAANSVALVYATVPPGKLEAPRKDLPPIFIVHASDDPKASPVVMAKLYEALQQSGRSVEMHAFHRGDHGFGIAPKSGDVRAWPTLYAAWLRDLGWISQ